MVKKSDTGAVILKKLLNIYIYLQFTKVVLRLARLETCKWRFNKGVAKHTTQKFGYRQTWAGRRAFFVGNVVDGKGKTLSSEGLASYIDKKCTEGSGEFSFLIGGSHGHNADTKSHADLLLSFGPMTFPHQLFRLMLTEQIYRALTINNKLPYHK